MEFKESNFNRTDSEIEETSEIFDNFWHLISWNRDIFFIKTDLVTIKLNYSHKKKFAINLTRFKLTQAHFRAVIKSLESSRVWLLIAKTQRELLLLNLQFKFVSFDQKFFVTVRLWCGFLRLNRPLFHFSAVDSFLSFPAWTGNQGWTFTSSHQSSACVLSGELKMTLEYFISIACRKQPT